MNIFPYWVELKTKVWVDQVEEPIRCFGRSNISAEDALRFAEERARRVQCRINGEKFPTDSEYHADIREEIVRVLDRDNIVTRNRYGAAVLNTTTLCFIDIDAPRPTWKWVFGFGPRKPADRKREILRQIEKRFQKPGFNRLSFRIYETVAGIRLLAGGANLDVQSSETEALMRLFHCDPLYAHLCRKQNCFRARLTPKSYRMKFKPHKVIFPRGSQEQENGYRAWVIEYDRAREKFAVCHFIREIGVFPMTEALRYHDQECKAFSSLPLA